MSYKGAAVAADKSTKSTSTSVSVGDYMAKKLITFKPDQPIGDVIKSLLKYKISGAPVVDDRGQLVGVISEGDCLKQIIKGRYDDMPIMSGKVSEHMAQNVITINAETNIFDAAKMFLEKRLRRFPVVENGRLIGQISQKDVMRAVREL